MDALKAYWIDPKWGVVALYKDPEESAEDPEECEWEINPSWLKAQYPSVVLFSRMEFGFKEKVRVWFYNSNLRKHFERPTTRKMFEYWIDPEVLHEVTIP